MPLLDNAGAWTLMAVSGLALDHVVTVIWIVLNQVNDHWVSTSYNGTFVSTYLNYTKNDDIIVLENLYQCT